MWLLHIRNTIFNGCTTLTFVSELLAINAFSSIAVCNDGILHISLEDETGRVLYIYDRADDPRYHPSKETR